MPDHVHLLLDEPKAGNPSTVVHSLKLRVSKRLRGKRRRTSLGQRSFVFGASAEAAQFWQRRFYDFNVWSQKKKVEKLHYMHMNPVKRGLVTHPRDWPWSSFSFYANRGPGLVRIDLIQ